MYRCTKRGQLFGVLTSVKSIVEHEIISHGGDWVSLLETRPLEDILADITTGWNDAQQVMGGVKAGVTTEVSYVL
ncbi:MAG TPA: hypothetical protein VFZ48_05315 [Candidatus Saccharimonadales bacterium]